MTEFTTLLSDLVLVESPRWHDNRLIFSDWGAGEVLAVSLDGACEVITRIDVIPFAWIGCPMDGCSLSPATSCWSVRLTEH